MDDSARRIEIVHASAAGTKPTAPTDDLAAALNSTYGHLSGADLLRPLIGQVFAGRIALVSSFGTEAAVLLALVASVDPEVPVIFLDTGKLFGETLRYRDRLAALLGLRDVRTIRPDAARLRAEDPDGTLWHRAPDSCCRLRKVEPLERAVGGFDAWISGRKRYQGGERSRLPAVEARDGRIKINPLADWSRERIATAFAEWGLPRHPLEADGFLSVGCMPCTDRVQDGEDPRAGRWRGRGKTECGIHLPSRSAAAASSR
ncbi:MAG TPA: phosphoadenylyl-sulfate reductase [Stellaceae bacterium]